MTYTTNTSAAHAAALAMRDAAAALARRRPLYDGASGEPADEELAQAIEDLQLPDADTTDWKAETERLRGLLRHEQQERHAVLGRMDAALAELAQAREVLRITAGLTAERDAALAELAELRQAARFLVDDIDSLISESEGVAGLHLNGDLADWGELVPGGRFERLSALDDVRALAAKGE